MSRVDGTRARRPGRPRGRSAKGEATRLRLYEVAISRFDADGFDGTTLRDIAREASVSPALLYKYFPNKSALVLELYDRLSRDFVRATESMPGGSWWARSSFAMDSSLETLAPHRNTLATIAGRLVADPEQGLFADATAFSRGRVLGVFERAVEGSTERLREEDARALARLVYLAHLGVILWWLLDRSEKQRATSGLVELLRKLAPAAGWALRLPGSKAIVRRLGRLVDDAFLRAA